MAFNLSSRLSKKFLFGLVIALVMFIAVGAFIFARSSDSHKATDTKNLNNSLPEYKYTYLGNKCRQGLANINLFEAELNTEATNIKNNAERDIANIKAQEEVDVAPYTAQFNQLNRDYDALDPDDYLSSNGITNATIAVSSQIVAIQKESARQQAAIAKTANDKLDEIRSNVAILQGRETKLTECKNLADSQHDFTATEVADYEALVTQSNTKP